MPCEWPVRSHRSHHGADEAGELRHAALQKRFAELKAAEPEGLTSTRLNEKLPNVNRASIVEVTGKAGDVTLLHPFVVHAWSRNDGKRIRFACNPPFRLKKPMELSRSDGAYSPVEKAICLALRRVSPKS